MKFAINILALLFLVSCNPSTNLEVSELEPAFEYYLRDREVVNIFVNRISGSTSQMIYVKGEHEPNIYRPVKIDAEIALLKAMRLGDGCVIAKSDRISTDHYSKMANELELTHLIMCPLGYKGYVGAGFRQVPDAQDLYDLEKIAELLQDGYV